MSGAGSREFAPPRGPKPGEGPPYLLVLALVAALAACATPSERFQRQADALGFEADVTRGDGFQHAVFRSPGGAASLLHVYLEGDASPRMAGRSVPPDPTPHRPLMLELMALDASPSILLGRPCQHGLSPGCDPALWTVARYGEQVVDSLVAATQREQERSGAGSVVLIGHSGGGALAMLMAEQLPQTRAVVTLAGNLAPTPWAEHHGYTPLSRSLDPAARPALDPAIIQVHLLAGRDERVPPALTRSAIDRQTGALTRAYPDFDHGCCWASVWPGVLADLARLLAQEPRAE